MTVYLSSLAALAVTCVVAPAHAETIQISPTAQATIESHDAASVFLPGAFHAVPSNWTDGSQTPLIRSAPASQVASTQSPSAGTSDDESPKESIRQIGAGGSSGAEPFIPGGDPESGGMGPGSGGPTQGLSPVPLPSTLPMFGAALLTLGGLAFGVRRRRANGCR